MCLNYFSFEVKTENFVFIISVIVFTSCKENKSIEGEKTNLASEKCRIYIQTQDVWAN